MKLTATELAYVRTQGLFITDKCDGCGKLLNQTSRYTISGKPEVYCSAGCHDLTFFGDTREAKRHSTPGRCSFCAGTLEGKRRGAIYCDEICKKRAARAGRSRSTAKPQITGTPTQLNQQVATPKKGGLGDCIASGAKPLRNASSEVSEECGLSAELEPATLGSSS